MTKQESALKKYLDWLEESPRIVKDNADGSEYVPISCVQEDLMTGYGGNTKMELLRERYHSEGLSGVGRLHYKHPVTGEWLFQDGSASIPFSKGMRLDFPSLSGHIVLSCAKKIGKRFGRDLNRDIEDAPFDQQEQKTAVNGRKKAAPVEMLPDSKIQQQYNFAAESLNQKAMDVLKQVYPSIQYTGDKKLNHAES